MSGGVDSSVAAALLLREGYEVVGCFMRLGSPGETLDELVPYEEAAARVCEINSGSSKGGTKSGAKTVSLTQAVKIGHQGCCSINDAADARAVAAQLNIPFYVCNFKKDFGRIIDYFVGEYVQGRTPNPCVRCNDWLKFGKLHDYARQIHADFVASGHYARVLTLDGEPRLLRGIDHNKDQSYVLFGVPRSHLSRMMLPIGGLEKPRVRELAKEFGLPVFDKPDSQEICFVPDNDYAGLVERRVPSAAKPGKIIDRQGVVVGTHEGQHHFTIGQRRGLNVAVGRRVYVVAKDAASNTVTIGDEEDLLTREAMVGEANWIMPSDELARFEAGEPRRVWAKYRYNTDPAQAVARWMPEADAGDGVSPSGRRGRFVVMFEEPQIAVAPGQAMVLFDARDRDLVLGGGWIAGTRM
jgi:tRNA-uridine 2-sulfurtransferase